ncbi:RTA1-domain-containing protein [Glonium stellatum]|uniref:RTA1-domain-containing protein n=1 Tax=Glonium stellatum TaxID=574774 RepID=A0A8E2JYK6_9PEZI|nr:RTA1-domain-containing protein [Glonium stellatum]
MPIPQFVGCEPWVPIIRNEYGYPPHLAPGVVFVTLFTISTILHIVQASWKRRWWCMLFALGALIEIIGWGGRIWSSHCPSNVYAFLMQITTLIIAPTFFTAGLYVILGRLIQVFGRHTSPISAKMYLWIFCACDILSLVIQAIGGGIASTAVTAIPPKESKVGTDIMVGGIIFQTASISIFGFFFIEFLRRVCHDRHNAMSRKIWVLVFASAFSCLTIYIRSIYRVVELLQGWSGYLITHENFFIALDGSLMLGAVVVFNFIHPGWFLPTEKEMVQSPRNRSEDGSSDVQVHNQKEGAGGSL